MGTPGPCGQDKGRASPTQPKGLLTNAPASHKSCPQGYSKTEGSRVPISMTTTVHLFQVAPVGVLHSLARSRDTAKTTLPRSRPGVGAWPFLTPAPSPGAWACGHQSWLGGSWKLPKTGAQSRAPRKVLCPEPPWQPELGAPRDWDQGTRPTLGRWGQGGSQPLEPVPKAHSPSGREAWPRPRGHCHSLGLGVRGLGGALEGNEASFSTCLPEPFRKRWVSI